VLEFHGHEKNELALFRTLWKLDETCTDTTTEINCRGGSKASVRAAASAALPRVFLQRVSL
jgi:hypothetical protein